MLALRAADPAGGPPWGIGLSRTAGGLLCAQVGRVVDGELGALGLDGAFHDDGGFHPDPAPRSAQVPGTIEDGDCVAPKETFAGEIDGLDRNAVTNPPNDSIALPGRREISFGLLGPHALSVTYRSGGRTRSSPVLRGLGAYLIVARAQRGRALGGTGAAPGGDYADDLQPAGLTGALTAITYRYGRTVCRDDGSDTIARCRLADHPLGPERTPSQRGM